MNTLINKDNLGELKRYLNYILDYSENSIEIAEYYDELSEEFCSHWSIRIVEFLDAGYVMCATYGGCSCIIVQSIGDFELDRFAQDVLDAMDGEFYITDVCVE